MKPKVVITLVLSVVLLSTGYWLYVNRASLANLVPSSSSDATMKAAPIANSLDSGGRARKSYEVLAEGNNGKQPPANANRYFFTEEQAKKMGLKKYRSGPCAGYYEGEEWACNPGRTEQGP